MEQMEDDEVLKLALNAALKVEDIDKLRDETPIGSLISFAIIDNVSTITTSSIDLSRKPIRDNVDGYKMIDGKKVPYKKIKVITGIVTNKYPYLFRLNNGITYTWTEYLVGKRYLENIKQKMSNDPNNRIKYEITLI